MGKIVLATGNPGKVREFSAVLAGLELEIVPQSAFNVPEAEETGLTFVENAILKARNAALHTGLPALADDSGLVVDALGGSAGHPFGPLRRSRRRRPRQYRQAAGRIARRAGGTAHRPLCLRVGAAAPSCRSDAADLSGQLGGR